MKNLCRYLIDGESCFFYRANFMASCISFLIDKIHLYILYISYVCVVGFVEKKWRSIVWMNKE